MKNLSPWLYQLDHSREIKRLESDLITDIAIIGGGIAGISTAFFLLKNTDKKVVIFEAFKIAHGATGHNAGQVCSYFEKPFYELVKEYGLEMASQGQRDIEGAWKLIDDIYTTAGLDIPFYRFMGLDGLSTYDQVIDELENIYLRKQAKMPIEKVMISEDAAFLSNILAKYSDIYEIVSQEKICTLLETQKREFIALSREQKGVINSALFCQEVIRYLLEHYKDRFSLYEETKINKVILRQEVALLDAIKFTVNCEKVILCTNGFENIEIFNTSGLDIDTKFHHLINGVVARMSGYLETINKPPAAINYYLESSDRFDNMEDPYFYLTRRPYEYEKGREHNLISVGGPQHGIPDREEYIFDYEYGDEVQGEISSFIEALYNSEPNKRIDYIFTWHGLMGYTPSGVRIIGSEPKNPTLIYNLGCNGVGILPSIYGGEKISRIINGQKVQPSIFDPR